MEQRDQDKSDLLEITASAVIWLFVVGVVALVLAWSYFMWRTSGDMLNTGEKLGQLGDFIGGSINPLLSLLTLFALGMTVLLQAKQLRQSREELRATRTELERAALAQEDGNRLMAEQLRAGLVAAHAQRAAADAQIESAKALTAQAEHARVAAIISVLTATTANLSSEVLELESRQQQLMDQGAATRVIRGVEARIASLRDLQARHEGQIASYLQQLQYMTPGIRAGVATAARAAGVPIETTNWRSYLARIAVRACTNSNA